jgi:hypothetical protein
VLGSGGGTARLTARAAFTGDFWNASEGGTSGYYRPLTALSLAADRAVHGDKARGYHITNLILHALVAALLVWILLDVGLVPVHQLRARSAVPHTRRCRMCGGFPGAASL